ncbi:WD40/YVTN repeat-like-containing domain,Zinc finger, RING-type,Zinc finger, RING/FYVE/PHD-type,WD40- [Cinara cedri]|uniref:WD40/YVTN repeat-like-containing domain,Zinc finger, RING-type,Zinc finger, RING/FYVE/PHD-type,WD40 n=1 Tax=Cinara cedri TaxID=506608 RepID=A0A5E4MUZ7_9HEMI|nr:WD40/YVTN repeat-like-containing domain,Zinc finger, RING-type,Zinc finger, RING/FYVE/PHD-type,WD40- [Cinara cedri]
MAVLQDNINNNRNLSDHILVLNRIDVTNIFNLPLKATQRIKYTCVEVSQNFIIFGASSGGLYVFRRQPCEFLQLLPNKEGSVTQIVVSKDEDLIAFGTQKGIVCILQRNENGIGAKLLNKSTEHLGYEITAMEWTSKNQLYFGDCNGKVTSIYVSLFVRKAIFQTPPYTMIELDSKVIQIDSSDDILVISTLTRCYVCDMYKEQFKQIGQKPRDGDYGCCIVAWNERKIFSARPGSRIWEVELNGVVKSTHQLKYCLAIPPTLNICGQEPIELSQVSDKNWPPQSLNFKKLYKIWENCLLTYTSNSIFIFDMLKINVLLWCNRYNNVQNVKHINDTLYIWSSNGQLIVEQIIPLQNFLVNCYESNDYRKCITLIEHYYDRIIEKKSIIDELYPLADISTKIELPVNTNSLITKIKKINYLKQTFFKLPSGIYSLTNYVYVKKKQTLQRSHSLFSIKSNKSIKRSKSMVNIHLDFNTIKKSEQYPHSDYSKFTDKHIFDQLYMELNISSIPFVSLATSDAFHDTLMEIGSNVTNQIVKSSKTLKDTLNNLTTTTSKNDLVPYDVSDITRRSEPQPINENEVDFPNYKLDLEHREKLNLLPILKIYEKLQSNHEFDIDCLQSLVSGVREVKSNLESILQVKHKSFPFRQYLKEKHLNTIKKAVNDSFISNLVLKWADIYAEDTLIVNQFDYPEFLLYYLTENDFKKDIKLGEFITLFSQIMELSGIFNFLLNDNLKCSYAIFCTILEMSCNNDEKTVPLLMYLNSMYVFLKLDQIESFRTLGYKRNIKPIFVFYLLMKFSVHLKSSNQKKCNTIFLSYLSHLNENYFNDFNVLYYAVYSFVALNHNETKNLCKCGFPLSNINGKFKKLGKILIEYLSTVNIDLEQLHVILHTFSTCDSSTNSLDDVIKCFCKQVPHLWQLVLESTIQLNSSKYTKIILSIHLGLVDQLDVYLNNKSEKLFDKIFTLNHYFKNGLCLNCGNVSGKNQGITWTDLAALAFQYLSPEEMKHLMHKHRNNIPRGDIDSWFYQSFVLTQLAGLNSKKIVIQTLKHHNNISMMNIKSCENILTVLEEELGTTIEFKNLYSNKSHWGTKIDFKNGYCIWCSLPLNSDPLIRGKNNGLVSFKCGHSFHTVCVRQQTDNIQCAVCHRKLI